MAESDQVPEGRKKGECGEYGCPASLDSDDEDSVSVDDEDKSRLDLASVTSTVSDKVSTVSSSLSSGVDVS